MKYLGIDYIEVPVRDGDFDRPCEGCAFDDDGYTAGDSVSSTLCMRSASVLGSCTVNALTCFAVSQINTP